MKHSLMRLIKCIRKRMVMKQKYAIKTNKKCNRKYNKSTAKVQNKVQKNILNEPMIA